MLKKSNTGFTLRQLTYKQGSSILSVAGFPETQSADLAGFLSEYQVELLMEKKLVESIIDGVDDPFVIEYHPRKSTTDVTEVELRYCASTWREIIAFILVASDRNISMKISVRSGN